MASGTPATELRDSGEDDLVLKLKEEGRTRAIGVANFNIALMKTVVEDIGAPIACNQVEYHVMLDQTRLRQFLTAKSIPLVAYCPLAQGRVADDATLAELWPAIEAALRWIDVVDDIATHLVRDVRLANPEVEGLRLREWRLLRLVRTFVFVSAASSTFVITSPSRRPASAAGETSFTCWTYSPSALDSRPAIRLMSGVSGCTEIPIFPRDSSPPRAPFSESAV